MANTTDERTDRP